MDWIEWLLFVIVGLPVAIVILVFLYRVITWSAR